MQNAILALRTILYRLTGWTWHTTALDAQEYGRVVRATLDAIDPEMLGEEDIAADELEIRLAEMRLAHNNHNRARPSNRRLTPLSEFVNATSFNYGQALKARIALASGQSEDEVASEIGVGYTEQRRRAIVSAAELITLMRDMQEHDPDLAQESLPSGPGDGAARLAKLDRPTATAAAASVSAALAQTREHANRRGPPISFPRHLAVSASMGLLALVIFEALRGNAGSLHIIGAGLLFVGIVGYVVVTKVEGDAEIEDERPKSDR